MPETAQHTPLPYWINAEGPDDLPVTILNRHGQVAVVEVGEDAFKDRAEAVATARFIAHACNTNLDLLAACEPFAAAAAKMKAYGEPGANGVVSSNGEILLTVADFRTLQAAIAKAKPVQP